MIGIVAVSHSARLGEAALELALQMVHDGGVRVKVAAGAGVDADGAPILGTDAVAVAARNKAKKVALKERSRAKG